MLIALISAFNRVNWLEMYAYSLTFDRHYNVEQLLRQAVIVWKSPQIHDMSCVHFEFEGIKGTTLPFNKSI